MQLKIFEPYLNFIRKLQVKNFHDQLWSHRGIRLHYLFMFNLVTPHLLHGIRCLLFNLLWCFLIPHDCENLGSQVTCYTCFQFLIYNSLKRIIERKIKINGLIYVGATTHLFMPQCAAWWIFCLLTICAHRSWCTSTWNLLLKRDHVTYALRPLHPWFEMFIISHKLK